MYAIFVKKCNGATHPGVALPYQLSLKGSLEFIDLHIDIIYMVGLYLERKKKFLQVIVEPPTLITCDSFWVHDS